MFTFVGALCMTAMGIWCSIEDSSRNVSSPTRAWMIPSQPMARDLIKRGASRAARRFMPWSAMQGMSQRLVGSAHEAKATLQVVLLDDAGMMAWKGRLQAARALCM